MAAFVGQHPHSGTEKALDEGVQCPEDATHGCAGDILGSDKSVEKDKGPGEASKITSNVRQTSPSTSLKAMGRDSVTNVLHAELRNLKFIAEGVDHLSLLHRLILV